MNPVALSLAYKFVAFAFMLLEINSFCVRTGLITERLFTQNDILQGSHVGPPILPDLNGSVLTEKYFFGFMRGHLANFYNRSFQAKTDGAIQARNRDLSKLKSLVDTNGAWTLATNWLIATGLDVAALEAKYRRNLIQWQYYPYGLENAPVLLPVYQVEWRGNIFRTSTRETAVVSVTVFGAAKEIVEHHILDDSLFLLPALRMTNRQTLLAISDSEFLQYTLLQQSNLVKASTATNHAAR